MKRKAIRKRKRAKRSSKTRAKRRAPRPRPVHQALRKLLNLAGQMQARAVELEDSLQVLRAQERRKLMTQLLSALRDTPAGNLIAAPPDWPGENGPDDTARGMLETLMEVFPIQPVHQIGDRIPVKPNRISETVELDRPIGDDAGDCTAVEVVSVGWSCGGKVLLKPMARPVG